VFQSLQKIEDRFFELEKELERPEVIKDHRLYQRYLKEHASIKPVVEALKRFRTVEKELRESKMLLSDPDPEIRRLAKEEIDRLEEELESAKKELNILLLPKDPNDEKDILLEIRAGTGGEEACLFAADLFRMYCRYAEMKGWKTEIMSRHDTGLGGFKEVIVLISGNRVYSYLKYESGIHRVQRIPETESQGRIHTSAVSVAILPEADEIEVDIQPDDLRIDVFRASGHGGQHVNVTDSAVRIIHIPTGLVVTCQDERSQHKNKAKALKILRSRLYELQRREQEKKISWERRTMVGSGDRSEKIRTYNFPQGRVTDHRIGLTLYRLEDILQGNLDMIIEPLIAHFQTEALKRAETDEKRLDRS